MPEDAKSATLSGTATVPVIRVSLSDFPIYDGSSAPDRFIQQCERLAALGGIADGQLQTVIAARCRGLALEIVEADGEVVDVTGRLRAAFGAKTSELAVSRLSSAAKGDAPVLEYATRIKELVRDACPEFYDASGKVKTICVPAHKAALYRHLLIGLSPQEKLLLSRQNVSTFDAAVDVLRREETLADAFGEEEGRASARVQWTDREVMNVGRGDMESPTPSGDRNREDSSRRERDRPSVERARRSPSPARGSWGRSRAAAAGGRSGGSPYAPSRGGPRGSPRRDDSPWPTRRGDPRRAPRRGDSPWAARRGDSRPAPRRDDTSPDSEEEWRPGRPGGRRGSPAPPDRTRREVRCWSCRGYGHLKRQCPNGY